MPNSNNDPLVAWVQQRPIPADDIAKLQGDFGRALDRGAIPEQSRRPRSVSLAGHAAFIIIFITVICVALELAHGFDSTPPKVSIGQLFNGQISNQHITHPERKR